MVERCAGLDVHRDDVVATTRVPGQGRRRFEQQTQTFKTTLPGLAELAPWLAAAGVTLVGMEATGVYWKTVFQALEDRFECWLVNAHHLRNVLLLTPISNLRTVKASVDLALCRARNPGPPCMPAALLRLMGSTRASFGPSVTLARHQEPRGSSGHAARRLDQIG